ncbi:AzlC family ABC transporter permease [Calidithermus timidus]|uniref:AzlC family ABC transporter permease n=1 Tax=Calidithermus timidus TaxID=307124 RepID=UPI00037F29F2|nr:AzlC family ABC transporter permease [Calidithermus timidus]
MALPREHTQSVASQSISDVWPSLLGVVPFGLITGAAGVSAGLSVLQTMASSLVLFAGAAQLAAYQLMGSGSPVLVVVLTVAVVNLRYLMYSASLAPYLAGWKLAWKVTGAYIMVDQLYALSLHRFREERFSSPLSRWVYYITGSALTWVVWQVAVWIGAGLGAKVPPSWSLDFAIPLSFMAMVFASIRDRPTAAAALVGGISAMFAATLPYNLGLIVASLAGIAAGMWLERKRLS